MCVAFDPVDKEYALSPVGQPVSRYGPHETMVAKRLLVSLPALVGPGRSNTVNLAAVFPKLVAEWHPDRTNP